MKKHESSKYSWKSENLNSLRGMLVTFLGVFFFFFFFLVSLTFFRVVHSFEVVPTVFASVSLFFYISVFWFGAIWTTKGISMKCDHIFLGVLRFLCLNYADSLHLWSQHSPQTLTKDTGTNKAKSVFHWLVQFCKCGSCFELHSEFAIWHVVPHSNINSIQNPSTVTNPTMEPYCILLPLTSPCHTTWQIANSLITVS